MDETIKQKLTRIEQAMKDLAIPREPSGLYEPVTYCLQNGGKRIRPLMTLLACELFGGDERLAMQPALGLELFHNFTLMHDDIMDQAPVRRGMPSVYSKWNINTAILSGDVLFSLACRLMTQVPDQYLRPVMDLFHQTVVEVCEGQQMDMDFETAPGVTEDEYLEMIRLKTAVLPAACLKTGAILAGASPEDAQLISQFGELTGMAFQLKDDWLDAFGDEKVFGKKTGGDIAANKKTWLYIAACEQGGDAQRKALQALYQGSPAHREEKVARVTALFRSLGVDRLSLEKMKSYQSKAMHCLDQIKVPARQKQHLTSLAAYLLEREM